MSKKNNVDPKIAEIVSNFKVSSLEEMNNIVNQLKKAFIENALNEEMTEHLGYENEIKILVKNHLIIEMVIQRKM